jgi:hypothetical protein
MRVLLVLLQVTTVMAGEKPFITIYQDGYAVIRETREVELCAGQNDDTIGNLPKKIEL